MSCAVLVYGPIGSGKTCTCLSLAERVRAEGVPVGGILSIRVHQDGELIGYDGLDPASGQVFPLVRLRGQVKSPDWFVFGRLIYAFSVPGFKRANRILTRSAEALNRPSIVFVDEFGRLERAGQGVYPGAVKVVEALRGVGVGVAVFTCRTDMVEAVEELVRGKARCMFGVEPGEVEALWCRVRGCVGLNI